MAVTLETYKKRKLSMLEKQFKLKLTEEDVDHMNSLSSEIEVDNFTKKLFDRLG